jgi:hypothetical protein
MRNVRTHTAKMHNVKMRNVEMCNVKMRTRLPSNHPLV